MTYQGLATQSLDIQDTCNLQAVVCAFARGIDVLAKVNPEGTDWINFHPIVTMFIDKLCQLNGGHYNYESYSTAYQKVREIAAATTGDGVVIEGEVK